MLLSLPVPKLFPSLKERFTYQQNQLYGFMRVRKKAAENAWKHINGTRALSCRFPFRPPTNAEPAIIYKHLLPKIIAADWNYCTLVARGGQSRMKQIHHLIQKPYDRFVIVSALTLIQTGVSAPKKKPIKYLFLSIYCPETHRLENETD